MPAKPPTRPSLARAAPSLARAVLKPFYIDCENFFTDGNPKIYKNFHGRHFDFHGEKKNAGLARSVPKPLKVLSLARSVSKPL